MDEMINIKYLSLFSGIGGFELGIQQAYEELCIKNKKKELQGIGNKERRCVKCFDICADRLTCIGYSEIDKYAIQIYQKHFNHKQYGDITKIQPKLLSSFDLLVGGFPCQSFSIAGKRKGFKDTRGTLFFEIARIIREKQPRLLLLENVKGLLSHDKGNTFFTIISTLDELGYDLQWQVLNSKNFGVPQNRERVFIVGHLRGTSRPQVFPFGEATKTDIQQNEELPEQISNTLRTNYGGGYSNETYILNKKGKKKKSQKIAATLTGGGHSGGNHSDMDLIQLNQPKHSNDRVYSEKGISPTLNTAQGGNRQPFIRQLSKYQGDWVHQKDELCRTLAASGGNKLKGIGLQDGFKIRRLTPTECERLQGFPDGWTEGVSDTQRYKTLGNAVTVNVVREIMKKLF